MLVLAATSAAAAPVDRTERLAAACNGCHGPDGRGSGAIPVLAGQEAAAITERLNDWRASEPEGRDHVMARFARGLSDADVRALADHYAALAAPDA
jgi:cytochrome c553